MMRSLGQGALRRALPAGASLLIVLAACGGAMSPTEYVEGLNNFVEEVGPGLDASVAAYEQIADPTMADWVAFVEREIALRRDLSVRFDALDAPDSIAEVHQILADAIDRGSAATEALSAVAATVSTPDEAEQTAAYAEYVAANSEGAGSVCREVQSKLDALVASGEPFANEPWLAGLTLTVQATLGCL